MSYGSIPPGLRRRIPFNVSEFLEQGGSFNRTREGLESLLDGEEVVEFELTALGEESALLADGSSVGLTGIVGSGAVAGSGGVISGGSGVISTTAAVVGTGIGLGTAIIGGVLGGLSGVAPFHKNLGPGNEPDIDGVDEDDRIAYRHDVRYTNANTQEDVVEADRIAIDEFDSDWQDTGNIHSVIGRTGIQIKKAVEHHTGVLYPSSLPTGKQWCEDIHLILIHIVILSFVKEKANPLHVGGIEPDLYGINGIETGRIIIYLE